jgi:hypothetical protein
MSELRTNKIYPRDGLPAGASGGIIQIVESSLSNAGATSTTSTSLVETGLEATITPSSSSNKILCIWSLQIRNDGARSGTGLRRNSTDIFGYRESYGAITDGGVTHTYQYLDSPATTSATTYKVMFCVNTGTALLNDVGGILVTGSNPHRITLMEVSG